MKTTSERQAEMLAEFRLQNEIRGRNVVEDLRKKLIALRDGCDDLLARLPDLSTFDASMNFLTTWEDYNTLTNLGPGLFSGAFSSLGGKIDTLLIEAQRAGEALKWTAPVTE